MNIDNDRFSDGRMPSFIKPASPQYLIINMKFAISSQVLMEDAWYTDENMLSFSGSNQISRREFPDGITEFRFNKLGEVVPDRDIGGGFVPSVHYHIIKQSTNNVVNVVKGGIHFALGLKQITYEFIEQMFGSGWKWSPALHVIRNTEPRPPTHKMGNQRVGKTLQLEGSACSLIAAFHPDGTLHDLSFSMEHVQ